MEEIEKKTEIGDSDDIELDVESNDEPGSKDEPESNAEPKSDAETDSGQKKKAKPKKRKVWHLYLLLGLAIAAVLVSGAGLGYELYQTRQAQTYYSDMTSGIVSRPRDYSFSMSEGPVGPESEPSYTGGALGGVGSGGSSTIEEEVYVWEPYVDFAALGVDYNGLSAWLLLEGTVIDYPVMHWRNNDYYLRRLPDGTSHRNGSLFIDYRNTADFTNQNTLIYGHDMRSGDMFGALKQYRKQAFYDENPFLYLFTPERDYAIVLIAGYLVDSAYETPPLRFKNESEFNSYISDIRRRSVFKSDVEVSFDDQLVSLCTCATDYTNARLIVVGKLVALGPFEPVEVPPLTLE